MTKLLAGFDVLCVPSRSKLIGHQALPCWQAQRPMNVFVQTATQRCWASLPHWLRVRRSQLWNLVSNLSDFVPGQGSKLLASTFRFESLPTFKKQHGKKTWFLQHLFQQLVVWWFFFHCYPKPSNPSKSSMPIWSSGRSKLPAKSWSCCE